MLSPPSGVLLSSLDQGSTVGLRPEQLLLHLQVVLGSRIGLRRKDFGPAGAAGISPGFQSREPSIPNRPKPRQGRQRLLPNGFLPPLAGLVDGLASYPGLTARANSGRPYRGLAMFWGSVPGVGAPPSRLTPGYVLSPPSGVLLSLIDQGSTVGLRHEQLLLHFQVVLGVKLDQNRKESAPQGRPELARDFNPGNRADQMSEAPAGATELPPNGFLPPLPGLMDGWPSLPGPDGPG